MLTMRLAGLLAFLLIVDQGGCKPTKSTETDFYSDDIPTEYSDEAEYPLSEDDGDTPGAVEESPLILSKANNFSVPIGSNVTLPCTVDKIGDRVVMWQKDSEFLYSNARPMTADADRIIRLSNNTLVIYGARESDTSDHYSCIILSDPEVKITHRLLVHPIPPEQPPTHTSIPASPRSSLTIRVTPSDNVVVRQGETISLGCHINIQPPPEMKWFHEDKKIHNGVEGNYLVLTKVTRHHAGIYQCLADNHEGIPPHSAIKVVVNYPPETDKEHERVYTGMGIESKLTCIVHSHPQARVVWFKNDREVVSREGKVTIKNNKNRHTLRILDTTEEDLGKYMCEAMNDLGHASKVITLTGVPSQAKILGGETTMNDKGLILKWHLESYSPISEYKLEYKRKGDTEVKVVRPDVKNGKGIEFIVEYTIDELQPGSYEAVLSSRNSFGWSLPSVPHVFIGERVSEEPESVKALAVTAKPGSIMALFLVVLSCVFTTL